MLTLEAKKLADHMADRLSPDPETGKRKIFHATNISNITEFLANFSLRTVGTNEALEEQIKRMRELISGIDPQSLKDNDKLREDVAAGFSKLSKSLDALVVDKPKRFINTGGMQAQDVA